MAHVETVNAERRSLHGCRVDRGGTHNVLTVRVPMAVAERVRAEAIANFRTVSGQLQALLNERYGSRDAEQRGAVVLAEGR